MNLMPLESFRSEFNFHPYHFWGISGTSLPVNSKCNTITHEYAWQDSDRAGRAEIRAAIEEAEHRIAKYLGYYTAPHFVSETIQFPKYADPRFDKIGYSGTDARWMTVNLKEARVNSIGVEARTLIANATVVYTDSDGDGIIDSWSVASPTTVTNVDEIAIYFETTDQLPDVDTSADRWRIQPVQVSIAGGIVTIRGKRWQLVKPVKYEGVDPDPVDVANSASFASEVDIYRRYTLDGTDYDTAQAILVWESRPYPLFSNSFPTTSTDPSATAYYYARVSARDYERGQVGFGEAVYDTTSGTWSSALHIEWWRPPDRLIVRYNAGIPLSNGLVEKRYRTMIARFAAAELARPICACDSANRELYRWQFDVARTGGSNDEAYGAVSQTDLTNPFGTCRGHIFAWRECQALMNWRGFSV